MLTEDLQIHYLELPKLPDKPIEDLEGIELWIAFLRESGKKGNEETINKLKRRNKTMKNAMESLERVSADERMLEIHRAREKSRMDLKSKLIYAETKAMERGMEKGMEKGIAQGREEGIKQSAIETAEELLRLGIDTNIISKSTKLSLGELNEIKERLNEKLI